MMYRILADIVVGLHFVFVVFVVAGGLLVLRWPKVAYAHVPAAVWGAAIEFAGWICPLTPLEKSLRARADGVAYEGSFIEHYILPVLYPTGLSRATQLVLGVLVIGVNVTVYWWVHRIHRKAG